MRNQFRSDFRQTDRTSHSELQKDRRILKKTEHIFFVYAVTYKQRFLSPESDGDLTFELSALQHSITHCSLLHPPNSHTAPYNRVYMWDRLANKARAPVGLQRRCVARWDGRMASCADSDAAERRRKGGRESANISKFRSPIGTHVRRPWTLYADDSWTSITIRCVGLCCT